jgi:hypothetical protein
MKWQCNNSEMKEMVEATAKWQNDNKMIQQNDKMIRLNNKMMIRWNNKMTKLQNDKMTKWW